MVQYFFFYIICCEIQYIKIWKYYSREIAKSGMALGLYIVHGRIYFHNTITFTNLLKQISMIDDFEYPTPWKQSFCKRRIDWNFPKLKM